MAGWEEELAVLLRDLGVKPEESPRTHPQPTYNPMRSDVKRREQRELAADALIWDNIDNISDDADLDMADDLESIEEEEAWLADLSLMRREVESIVAQVTRLIQRGDLEPSLKEDIMVVLRALRRRGGSNQSGLSNDESYLEFASELLHFCRLVLRLSETTIEDN
jgi:hypothetical protein